MTSSVKQTITIAATTWPFGIPTGMPISIAAVADFEWVTEEFTATGAATQTVTGPLSQYDHNNWIRPHTGGVMRRFYNATPAKLEHFAVDDATTINWGTFKPMNGESIFIEYKRPRS